MSAQNLREILFTNFPFEPTRDQAELLGKLAQFLSLTDPDVVFILKGYAGTGKTTTVGAVVQTLLRMGWLPILMAPTGRAAKVMSGLGGRKAFTIHKMIYSVSRTADGKNAFHLQTNRHRRAVFLVDEASMIAGARGGQSDWEARNLLDDLVEFVGSGDRCKLIFIGDTAQLPPVHSDLSPALDPKYLNERYYLQAMQAELKDVVRQHRESGILWNATAIREKIRLGAVTYPKFKVSGFPDVFRINGEELEEALEDAYSTYGAEDTVVICRSNKRAYLFNQQIRIRIRWQEDEISAGDYIMAVRNNYFWVDPKSKPGFIANGDILEVQRVGSVKELYGFRFAEATLRLTDYPDEPDLEAFILLDTLKTESPSLPYADSNRLYLSVLEDYQEERSRRDQMAKLRANPYYNALQVKFSYAVTCHKAQGGQWKCVFVDQGYLTKDGLNTDYLRWLYTALSRATERVYLVNFHADFFGKSEEDGFWPDL